LVGIPKGKRPLRRPRRRWEDIRMDLTVGGCGLDYLAQDRYKWRAVVYMVIEFLVP
jgi:hypothetical protein